MKTECQVLVCQRGARHRYAIPRLLNESGMLAALYTDSTAYGVPGRVAGILISLGCAPKSLKGLAGRKPHDIPVSKVFSSDRPLFSRLSNGRISDELAGTFMTWGLQGASVVYSMYGEDYPFLKWAKEQGANIIVDVFVHPCTNRIVAEEELRLTGRQAGNIEHEDFHSRRAFELADLLLCPSQWVADGVREFAPDCRHKVQVLPYGSSLSLREKITESPRPGRILFAGRDPVRKGLHHLARAASIVNADGNAPDVEIRVAGIHAQEVDWMEHHEQLNCLGILPMDQMHTEFAEADVFVLPSLSEGQAGVLLEAMSFGCPVVATRESGVDFKPGCGITVPANDPEALAASLIEVVGNRALRKTLAEGALGQAAEFSMSAWKARLVDAVLQLGNESRKEDV